MKDLFKEYETLPIEVKEIIKDLEKSEDYKQTQVIKAKLEKIGYTFNYYLDNTPYYLRKVEL